MTMSQKLITTLKPLSLCLTTILLTSFLTINTAEAQNATGSSNVMTSSPSTSTTTTNSTTGVVTTTNPTTTGAATTTAPTTTTATTTAPTTTTATMTKPALLTVSAKDPSTVPMDQPSLTDNDVLNWATQVAQLVYTYDFKNYPKQIPMLQENFTPAGWAAFSSALNKSNNLNVVQHRKLVASATPTGKAVLLKEGPINGIYTWRIQIPMIATYESESRFMKQNLVVTILVTRAKTPKGVGISHFLAVEAPAVQPNANTNLTANGFGTPSSGSSSSTGTTSPTNVPGPITTPPPGAPSDTSDMNSRSMGSTPGMNMAPVTPQGTPNSGYGAPSTGTTTTTPSQ